MVAKIQVQPVQRNELVQLLVLYQHLNADDPVLDVDQQLEELWDEILSNPRVHCLVGELDGELVASCIPTVIPNLTQKSRPYGLIENVVTRSDYRRRSF